VADKNFKVKTGLDLPQPLSAAQGGTGQSSLTNALNAMLPVQTSAANKVLASDGTNTTWTTLPTGYKVGSTASRPVSPTTGDLYYNTDESFLQVYDKGAWYFYGLPAKDLTAISATDQGTGRAYNNGQMSVSFTPDYTGGVAKTLTVYSSPQGLSVSATTSPVTFTGLTSGVQHQFYAFMSNSANTSQPGGNTLSTAVTATTVPQAPTISAVAGDSQAVLTLTGATGGSAITSYTITSSPATTTKTASSSPYTFTGLTNGTAYTFTATATNANGTSAASSASSSITPATQGSMYHIATTTVTSGSPSTITFSSIPNTYSHLMIIASVKAIAGVAGATGQGEWRMNVGTGGSVDTTTNYTFQYIEGDSGNSKTSSYNAAAGAYTMGLGWYQAGGLGGNYYNPQIIYIYDYTSTSKAKTITSRNGFFPMINSGNTSIEYKTGAWKNTSSALDVIQCYSYTGGDGIFADNSVISLYGVM
jgi:hypothetical protein